MKTSVLTLLCLLFLSGHFATGLIGAETDKSKKDNGENSRSDSDVTDFTKTSICGYYLGAIIDDRSLKMNDANKSGVPTQCFNIFNSHHSNYTDYHGPKFTVVETYEKRLVKEEKKRGLGETDVSLFRHIKLFRSKKDHKLIAICLRSFCSYDTYTKTGLKDIVPVVKDIFKERYNISEWNNIDNKYFDFLKKDENAVYLSNGGYNREFFFDKKTLVYLLYNYHQGDFGMYYCNVEAYFFDVNCLDDTIEFLNEQIKKADEEILQKEKDKKNKQEQEIMEKLKKERQDAEKRL